MKSNWYTHYNSEMFLSYISQKRILGKYKEYFCKSFYHLINRDNEIVPLRLEDLEDRFEGSFEGIINLIKEKKQVDLVFTRLFFPVRTITFSGDSIAYRGKKYSPDEFKSFLRGLEKEAAIIEHVAEEPIGGRIGREVTLVVINDLEEKPVVADAYYRLTKKAGFRRVEIDTETGVSETCSFLPSIWREACEMAVSISSYLASFEVLRIDVELLENRIILRKVMPKLNEYEEKTCCDYVKKYINRWSTEKENISEQKQKDKEEKADFTRKWNQIAAKNHRKGMRPYMAFLYETELEADKRSVNSSDEEKQWAWDRGFFSYRIKELGLNENNYRDYVSDYDYFWVNRINNNYQCWIQDKLTSRYVLEKHKALLPKYYYAVRNSNGRRRYIALPDLPSNFDCTDNSLYELLKEKGILAIKKKNGAHGEGFFKFEAYGNRLKVNGKEMSLEEAISIISPDETVMLVTEYVEMHPLLKNIFPDSLNTVRVNCFSETETGPQIGACFVKFGHSKGGYTDNINTEAGGIIVELDKNTGEIILPEFKAGNSYSLCNIHPDTGVPISGTIPYWEETICIVKEIASGMPQLQYFGFDIAITENGPKIIEVNVFPDYTKYVIKDKPTQAFLKKKVLEKRISQGLPVPMKYGEKKTFDVIVPAYNAEKYIDECLQSLINQTIGFIEHIKVIIVDDGSSDSTYQICMKYCKDYPDNIICIRKDNGGISKARNTGLQYSRGKYVTFCDSDDYWSTGAFEKVAEFFETKGDKYDVIECRAKWFEKRNGFLQHDYRFNKGTRIVNIVKEPENIQLAVNSAFFRGDAARSNHFEESITIGEDSRYVNEIILKSERFGLLKEAVYFRRARKENTSITQNANLVAARSVYVDTLTMYYQYMYGLSRKKYGRVIPYVQYLIMDAIRYRASIEIPTILPDKIKKYYREALLELIRETDVEVLFGLINGSIGQRARVIKYKLEEYDEVSIAMHDGNVFLNGRSIGKHNLSDSCKIKSIFAKGKKITINGEIRLPWFVDEPSLWCSSDRIRPYYVPLKKIKIAQIDMMGEEAVNVYSFSINKTLKNSEHLSFQLEALEDKIRLLPNIKRATVSKVDANQRKHELILRDSSRFLRRVTRRIKRTITLK